MLQGNTFTTLRSKILDRFLEFPPYPPDPQQTSDPLRNRLPLQIGWRTD
jgi:hypothetical protein